MFGLINVCVNGPARRIHFTKKTFCVCALFFSMFVRFVCDFWCRISVSSSYKTTDILHHHSYYCTHLLCPQHGQRHRAFPVSSTVLTSSSALTLKWNQTQYVESKAIICKLELILATTAIYLRFMHCWTTWEDMASKMTSSVFILILFTLMKLLLMRVQAVEATWLTRQHSWDVRVEGDARFWFYRDDVKKITNTLIKKMSRGHNANGTCITGVSQVRGHALFPKQSANNNGTVSWKISLTLNVYKTKQ